MASSEGNPSVKSSVLNMFGKGAVSVKITSKGAVGAGLGYSVTVLYTKGDGFAFLNGDGVNIEGALWDAFRKLEGVREKEEGQCSS